ncbi:MAG TPA: hypothetical protein VFF63_02350 [Candidatus Babeliales bacterium]|nr:hypothetical protein [Candidatus Babeliales bacterium]
MSLHRYRWIVPTLILFASAACGTQTVPSNAGAGMQISGMPKAGLGATDNTSILKNLKKDVVIGSTIDSKNGDKGPGAISIVPGKQRLKTGDLVVCNFEDSAGKAGAGTTIEILAPQQGSSPTRFTQSDSIEGCDANALARPNYLWAGGQTSGEVVRFSSSGKLLKVYKGSPVAAPLSDVNAGAAQEFAPNYIFVGATTSGGIVSISTGFYGDGIATQVAEGFAVGSGSEYKLGPTGLQYDRRIDTLYIVDGVTSTIVAFSHASDLIEKDEIVVESGGKKFKCKEPKVTCASLVYSGSPLDAPYASALLPNGNLVVANTQGTANALVELTPQGQVLDTKVVDSSKTQGVFGLVAAGTNDDNTVLFFADANSNDVQELEP